VVLATTALTRATPQRCYTPREATCQLPPQGAAILFGPEDHGLSNDDLSYCQGIITIPTAEYTSLNLAQAVTIIAYEWFLSRSSASTALPEVPLAERQALEGMYEQLRDTLYLIGYTDSQRERGAMRFFRRVFDAAGLSHGEVQTLRGLWRQVQWAARGVKRR
jgi:tRNA/rRNA methyltransferase